MNNSKIIKFIFGCIFTIACLFIFNTTSNAASFDASISKTSVTVGDTFTVTVKANNAAGMYSVSSSNSNVSVSSGSSSEFLENASATITFKANKAGNATITAKATDMTDLDDDTKAVTGSKSFSVTIKAKSTTNTKPSTTTPTETAPSFSNVNETVYCTSDGVNVRSSYSTSSSVLGSLSKNESLKRTGVATKAVNGITWSKVTYNGKTAYVSSSYLTKTKPATTSTENKTTDDKKNDNTNKDDKKDENTKSSNKNLKSLVVTPSSISPKFSASTTEYAMTIGSDVDEVEIKAEAEDSKAEVLVEGNKNLKIGENTITIKVTAEDETVRTYKIAVTKEKKDQVGLKELLIEGVKLNPDFDANTYLYTVDMENKNLSELNITATANKEKATVEIIGNTNLTVGNNVITILVKESDTETATYQINVNIKETVVAESKNDNDLYKKIGMGVLGAVVLIAIVVTIVKMRKDNDDDEIDYKEEKKSSVKQKDLEEDELPKSLRKHKNEEQEERTEKDKERSKKIDELYSLDDNELAEKRRRGKHF